MNKSKWRPEQKYLLHQNATKGEPSIFIMARWWGLDELELLDEVNAIKQALHDQTVGDYDYNYKPRSVKQYPKKYHTGTEHLIPSKLKAPAGKRAYSMAPPDDIDKPKEKPKRAPAVYSNRDFVGEILGETG